MRFLSSLSLLSLLLLLLEPSRATLTSVDNGRDKDASVVGREQPVCGGPSQYMPVYSDRFTEPPLLHQVGPLHPSHHLGLPVVHVPSGVWLRNGGRRVLNGTRQVFTRVYHGMTNPWEEYCPPGSFAHIWETKRSLHLIAWPHALDHILTQVANGSVSLLHRGDVFSDSDSLSVDEKRSDEVMREVELLCRSVVRRAFTFFLGEETLFTSITRANLYYLDRNPVPYAINILAGVPGIDGWIGHDEVVLFGRVPNSLSSHDPADWSTSVHPVSSVPCEEADLLS